MSWVDDRNPGMVAAIRRRGSMLDPHRDRHTGSNTHRCAATLRAGSTTARWEAGVGFRPAPERAWWTSGSFDGLALPQILASRDIARLFRFLKTRGFSRAAIAAATGLSETRVRAIMQGGQQVTSYEVLERVAHGLDIDRGLMGLSYTASDPAQPAAPTDILLADPCEHPDFLGVLAAYAVGAPARDAGHLLPAPPPGAQGVPAVVTRQHVDVLRDVSQRHRQFDADRGGGSCRDSALAYLRWAYGMLHARHDSDATTRDLKATLADMYQVIGWACHDLGEHGAARRYLTAGLDLARQIDDLPLIAGAFYRLGRVSIHQHRAQEALRLWQLGQIVAQDSGCLVSVAVLHANEAWAYAVLGSDTLVCDALARAEGELARVDLDTVPSWARFFLAPADINGIAGVIYTNLAAHPDHRAGYAPKAIERSAAAYQLRQAGENRSRTFDAISLATACLLDEDLDQAERYGHTAIDMTEQIDSARAVDRLRGFADLARPHAGRGGLGDVVERVSRLATYAS
jgi:transcriptional regulator with XRE-family HTH domain